MRVVIIAALLATALALFPETSHAESGDYSSYLALSPCVDRQASVFHSAYTPHDDDDWRVSQANCAQYLSTQILIRPAARGHT
jgi:hypothetical protein